MQDKDIISCTSWKVLLQHLQDVKDQLELYTQEVGKMSQPLCLAASHMRRGLASRTLQNGEPYIFSCSRQ